MGAVWEGCLPHLAGPLTLSLFMHAHSQKTGPVFGRASGTMKPYHRPRAICTFGESSKGSTSSAVSVAGWPLCGCGVPNDGCITIGTAGPRGNGVSSSRVTRGAAAPSSWAAGSLARAPLLSLLLYAAKNSCLVPWWDDGRLGLLEWFYLLLHLTRSSIG